MKAFFNFSFLLFLISSVASRPSTTLENACKKAVASNHAINIDFCMMSLENDPNSETADAKGLALIATKLSVSKMGSTQSKIASFKYRNPKGPISEALGVCLNSYNNELGHVMNAIDLIKSGDLHSASSIISAAMAAPKNCEAAFGQFKAPPLLKEEDGDVSQLLAISSAFTV